MAHVTVIVSGAQVEYRVAEGHGCGPADLTVYPKSDAGGGADRGLEYRVQGMGGAQLWVGGGLADVGLTAGRPWMSGSASADANAARSLMDGVHPMTGEQLVAPVLRLPNDAKLPGVPLVDAVIAQGLESLVGGSGRADREWARLQNGAKRLGDGYVADVRLLARIAARTGVNLDSLYGADRVLAAQEVAAGVRTDVRTKGYDLTLTLPKSFSVAWALAPEEDREAIGAAYTQAALDTVAVAEGWHAQATRGHHGDGKSAKIVETSGLLGWLSVDPVNRNGDAHWHAHVTLAAIGKAADGQWSALASAGTDSLFGSVGALGGLMEARARAITAERFGWEYRESAVTGRLEVAHVPDAAIRATSTRRADVVQAMLDAGLDPAHVSSAEHDSAGRTARRAKTEGAERVPAVVARTRAQVQAEGLNPVLEPPGTRTGSTDDRNATDGLAALRPSQAARRRVDGLVPGSWAELVADARTLLLDEAQGPTAHESTFTWRRALGIVAAGVHGLSDVAAYEQLLAQVLDTAAVVRLPDRAGRAPVFTLSAIVAAERAVLDAAATSWFGGAPTVTDQQLDAAVAAFTARAGYPPSGEQLDAVRRVCQGGASFDVLTGLPGTGKTAVMRIVAHAYAAAGHQVTGVSTAAIAAEGLAHEAGIPATTIARHLHPSTDHPAARGRAGVLIVDEAGMVDTRAMAVLLQQAADAGMKVVAVGDDRQLPPVGIGGWFAPARELTRGPVLVDVRRQTAEHEQAALRAFRGGQELTALAGYAAAGQIVVTDTRDQALAAAAALWHTHATRPVEESGRGAVVEPFQALAGVRGVALLAGRRNEAQVLNTLARARAREAGQLAGEDVSYRLMGGGQLRVAAGDVVLLRRNEGAGPVAKRNGRHAVVEHIDADRVMTLAWTGPTGDVLRCRVTPGDVVAGNVATGYAEAGHVQGGAATTVHLSQGRTVDHTIAVIDPGAHAGSYVALSRDRTSTTLVLSAEAVAETPEDLARLAALPPAERTAAVVTAYAGRLHEAGVIEAERRQLLVEQWPELLTPGPTGRVRPDGPLAAGLVTGMMSGDLAHLSLGARERTTITGGGVAGVLAPGDRWLPIIDAVDPRVAADGASWPFVWRAMDRMQGAGMDVPTVLATVTANRPLPQDSPGWALVSRLTSAGVPRDLWLARAAAQARSRAATVEKDSPRRSDPRHDPPAPAAPHRGVGR